MVLGNDMDNFHNFFHQLLMLWINHVVLSLMSQLVHIFSLTMLSFVSISSLTVFVFPQVLRSQSDVAGVSLLVPKLHTRASSAPKLRIASAPLCSIRLQSTNHRFAPNFPDLQSTNRRLISRFHQLILKLIRLVFQTRSSQESC